MKLVGIEAGGTKFILGVSDEKGTILVRERIDTLDPQTTLNACVEFIQKHQPDAVGIACFGPLDLDPASPTYGNITSTPKPGWRNAPVLSTLKAAFQGPINIDTDVNGAALAESLWGAGQGKDPLVYITIGTGIGAGLIVNGQTVHGMLHPEFGHIQLRSHPEDTFEGVCPYHKCCFEGLASGPSIEKRFGTKADALDLTHLAWKFESYYLAQACANLVLTLSPQRIILGGGVMHQDHLFKMVTHDVRQLLNGYVQHPSILEANDYIVAPGLGDNAGLLGAFALAKQRLSEPR